LDQVLQNFKKFETGKEFKKTSLGFIVDQSKIVKSWTVSDKTPEMQKITQMQYGERLTNLGSIFYGKPATLELESDHTQYKIPYLRISDIQSGLINSPLQKLVAIKDKEIYSQFLIREDDVLVSCQGTIGKVALARKKDTGILPSPQIIVVRPNTRKILPEYLVQVLNSKEVQYQLVKKSQGTFISRLNKDDLGDVIVSSPPISKQQKLVSSYQKEKEKIENLEKQLEQARSNLSRLSSGE
jgi:type I restriction enzyme S subunit